jgi:hypothetical protein
LKNAKRIVFPPAPSTNQLPQLPVSSSEMGSSHEHRNSESLLHEVTRFLIKFLSYSILPNIFKVKYQRYAIHTYN